MAAKVNFVKIPHDAVKNGMDTNSQPKHFNTAFHTVDEAPGYESPSEAAYSFKRWLPVVLKSRNLPASVLQVVRLTIPQTRLLIQACDASITKGSINLLFVEDVEDVIEPAFARLVFPPEGLFMRLDACSPKDGAQSVPGQVAVHRVKEAVLRLVTSLRCRNALVISMENIEGGSDSGSEGGGTEIYFLPFNDRMRSEREYRVFCPPSGKVITGISQYRWHKEWMFNDRSDEQKERVVKMVIEGARELHRAILADVESGRHVDDLLLKQGFAFDVFYDEEHDVCQLVELNVFGIRSGCGCCLFQWVDDRAQLYGEGSPGWRLEFRVSV
ncbi:hypothetical protein Daus18300_007467 [Diaporthe australafricana]|uniref:Cell division cycle protein 123 n=1 Tax=Diaporthe australafricana TaxID=127596 RepID=A0ABR3WN97_9PEZI